MLPMADYSRSGVPHMEPNGDKYSLRAHQIRALHHMDKAKGLGLFYDPGTGKTAIAFHWIRNALKDGRIGSALVVCPASLVSQWNNELKGMMKFEGWTRDDILLVFRHIHISSYQKLYNIKKRVIHHRDGTTETERKIVLRDEVDRNWGVVFMDESHALGSHSSVQTKVGLTLSHLCRYRFIMTGTPVSGSSRGSGEDFEKLFGQMQFITQERMWRNWTDFCNKMVVRFDRWNKPMEYDVESCRNIMKRYAIVARIEDCADMPEVIEIDVPCELMAKKVYKDVKSRKTREYGFKIRIAGGAHIKLLQICSGSLKNDQGVMDLDTSKDHALETILDGTDDRVVIFCQFHASITRCEAICKKKKLKTVIIDGSSEDGAEIVFQKGKADVIICQYDAGNAGLNLQISSTMVLFEPTRSVRVLKQAMARIYRQGQRNTCRYHHLYTPGTIEQKAMESVRHGKDVTDEMLKQWAEEEGDF